MPKSRAHRRALIVIDVQNEYVSGALPIEYPPPAQTLPNIGRAIDHARQHRIPVVVVRQIAAAGSPLFARGSHGAQLHEAVASRPHGHLIDKTLPSAFAGTDLADWLAAHEIDTLSVLGYMTHNCVDATIRQALHMGLEVEFLHDASGSVSYANRAGQARAEDIHRAFSVVLQSRFAAVLGTDEWIACVDLGIEPERDSIYWSHARGLASAADAAARSAADPATVPIT
ncbi:MAG TPA: cysteine hydrolase family protein [Burkholderiaceae bacterium]|nr:cysteine hydrolase family protein [Burkholderiaceae bacterium]